jgi:uncharacterized membrane protein YecN with MAPEG domain
VFPLAGIWVCFCQNMMKMCAVISPSRMPGISSTWMMYILGTMS